MSRYLSPEYADDASNTSEEDSERQSRGEPASKRRGTSINSDASSTGSLPPPTDVGELMEPTDIGTAIVAASSSSTNAKEPVILAGESRVDARLREMANGTSTANRQTNNASSFSQRPSMEPEIPDVSNDALIAQLLAEQFAEEDRLERERERQEEEQRRVALIAQQQRELEQQRRAAAAAVHPQIVPQTPVSLAPAPPPSSGASFAPGAPPPPPKPPRTARLIQPEPEEETAAMAAATPAPSRSAVSQLYPGSASSISTPTAATQQQRKPSPAWLQAQKDRDTASALAVVTGQSHSPSASRNASRNNSENDLPEPPSPERPDVLRGSGPPTEKHPTAPTGQQFLAMLKSPPLAPLLPPLRSFLTNFPNVPLDRRPQEFQNYMARMITVVSSIPVLANHQPHIPPSSAHPSSAGVEFALEGIEKLLLTKSYHHAFAPQADRDADLKLFRNLVRHSWVGPEVLEVRVPTERFSLWSVASQEVNKLDQYRSPRDKLTVLVNAVRVVVLMLDGPASQSGGSGSAAGSPTKTRGGDGASNLLDSPTSAGPGSPSIPPAPSSPNSPIANAAALPNADTLLPALICLLIASRPRALPSNLHYISRYRSQPMSGEESYILTTFGAAAEWASTMTFRELHLDEEEWRAKCGVAEARFEGEKRKREEAERARVAAAAAASSGSNNNNGGSGESLADTLLKPLQFLGKLLDDAGSPGPSSARTGSRSASFHGSAAAPTTTSQQQLVGQGAPIPPPRSASQPPPADHAHAAPQQQQQQQSQLPSPFFARLSETERRAYEDFEAQMAWALRQSEEEAKAKANDDKWEDSAGLLEERENIGGSEERGRPVQLEHGPPPPIPAEPTSTSTPPKDLLTGDDDDDELPLLGPGSAGLAGSGSSGTVVGLTPLEPVAAGTGSFETPAVENEQGVKEEKLGAEGPEG